MVRTIVRYMRFVFITTALLTTTTKCFPADSPAPWTILTYIQADNDLAPFANYNISDMELALAQGVKFNQETDKTTQQNPLNILVQWDQPRNNKTWRYKITPTGRIEDESVAQEMGVNPTQEIVDAMKWVKRKYPAKHYGLILWNHGSGVEDYRLKFPQLPKSIQTRIGHPWLAAPGILNGNRGILYDDSQETCLTNQGLSTALAQVKQILGKNLSILGMDACLMAMVEIVYQIKGYVDILVASEETEPGYGWSYSGFMAPLAESPATFTPTLLAQGIVYAYGNFYAKEDPDHTQSAILVKKIADLKKHIDQVVSQIKLCKKYMSSDIKDKVLKARRATQTFAVDSYIDLYSFYTELIKQCAKTAPKSAKILDKIKSTSKKTNTRYAKELKNLSTLLSSGLSKIRQIVVANVAGNGVPNAHGISIYYPNTRYSTSAIHNSYVKTQFAKESKWLDFIKEYRSK